MTLNEIFQGVGVLIFLWFIMVLYKYLFKPKEDYDKNCKGFLVAILITVIGTLIMYAL